MARHLGGILKTQVFDTDDFLWRPSDPPYQSKRPLAEREALMEQVFLPRSDWILAGSPVSWETGIAPRLTHVIFLLAPTPLRLSRLEEREAVRRTALGLDGPVANEIRVAFLDWSARYDNPHFHGRSRAAHEDWLSRVSCPVIRLIADKPPEELAQDTLAALDVPGLAD